MYALEIDDGDCTLHARGTCAEHHELIDALMTFSGYWYPLRW